MKYSISLNKPYFKTTQLIYFTYMYYLQFTFFSNVILNLRFTNYILELNFINF